MADSLSVHPQHSGFLPHRLLASREDARYGLIRSLRWIAMAFWSAGLVLSPFYIFPSGLPQPSDMALACSFGLALIAFPGGMPRQVSRFLAALAVFVAYVCLVSGAWAFAMGDLKMSLYALYYVFNLLSCLAFVRLYQGMGTRFLHWTVAAVGLAVVSQVAVTLVMGGATRSEGTFNNPNQLGYFALLATSLYWLASTATTLWRPLRVGVPAIFLACVYLSLVSQSRAATASIGILLLLASITECRAAAYTILVGVLVVGLGLGTGVYQPFATRVERRAAEDGDEFTRRGYDRILQYPQYLAFGAGEGGRERFARTDRELHSSLGTIVFSYGLLGVLAFLSIAWQIFRASGKNALLYLLPVCCYSVTHQGLRQSEFWILLAMLVCMSGHLSARTTRRMTRFQGVG